MRTRTEHRWIKCPVASYREDQRKRPYRLTVSWQKCCRLRSAATSIDLRVACCHKTTTNLSSSDAQRGHGYELSCLLAVLKPASL